MNGDQLNDQVRLLQYNNQIKVSSRRSQILFFSNSNGSNINYLPDSLLTSDILVTTEMPKSGEIDQAIKGAFHSGSDTELRHIKSVIENFTFKGYGKIIPYNKQDEASKADPVGFDVRVINQLLIDYDRRFFYGDDMGNVGFYNNANMQAYPSTALSVIGDLSALMENLRTRVILNTFCAEGDVRFVLSGLGLRTFLNRRSGGFQQSNRHILEQDYGLMWTNVPAVDGKWVLLDPNTSTQDSVSAYSINQTSVHATMLPKIYNRGRNTEKYYDFTHYATGSNAANIIEKGAITAPVTISPV